QRRQGRQDPASGLGHPQPGGPDAGLEIRVRAHGSTVAARDHPTDLPRIVAMAPRDPHREVFDDDLLDPVAGEDRDRPEPAPVRRRRRGWRVAVVGLLTLTLLAVGTVAGYLAFLNWRVSTNVTHREMLPDGPITA